MRVHCIVTIHFEFLKNSRSHLAEAQERITSGYKQTGGGGGGAVPPSVLTVQMPKWRSITTHSLAVSQAIDRFVEYKYTVLSRY